MGLFDDAVQGNTASMDVTLSRVDAFLGILLIGMLADGDVSDDELDTLGSVAKKHKFLIQEALLSNTSASNYGRNSAQRLCAMYAMDRHGFVDTCVQSLPEDWKKPTFTILTNLMFADGTPCQENLDVLNYIYKKLGIPADDALSVFDVVKQLHYFDY